jgi:SPP1 family predicted phage head-tail adaptor
MNKVVEVKLISQTEVYNEMGIPTITETKTTVIGNFSTVSAQEFFRGGEMGIKPEFIVKIWANEYNGETLLEFGGKRYIIYRMYLEDSGRCELYCQKDVGA